MGNAVPLRMCRDEAAVASVGRRRRCRPKKVATDTGGAAVVPLNNKQRDDIEQEGLTTRVGRRCSGKAVSWAGGVGDDDAGGSKAPAATVGTVKIVLRRKDAEALVARLNAQSARERKARMAEIKGELRAGECCGGGGASPASCRDAWRPQLAPIKEN